MKSQSVAIQMKATEQYFPVVLFIMLYKVVLTSESVEEILKCDLSNESYRAVLFCGADIFPSFKGKWSAYLGPWNSVRLKQPNSHNI